jgi:hypothetical protein
MIAGRGMRLPMGEGGGNLLTGFHVSRLSLFLNDRLEYWRYNNSSLEMLSIVGINI